MLYVIGLGPGGKEEITPKAMEALATCDIIAGYTIYIDLIRPYFPEKEFLTTPMKQEVKRCTLAIETALTGKTVAMVCSGDAGVYGMAGLIFELAQSYPNPPTIKVIGGITAACSGAAVLGAPLMHDFAVISLSDLLTPWKQIEARLRCAAQGDFVICLYNPASKKRQDYLQKACDILLESKTADTVCGWVKNIGREGETAEILSLGELRNASVDMFTTVYIGNSKTKDINGFLVTPRGYPIP
ncbi:MAG: precorrin-3B C(17)-methyltransferase [Clostridiales bacterium]|jgi:precorrin-3B C17-methyltransferase|nr:precorrin-3B C(17)-methyltransferase [Clostridiales bacterium]